MHCPRVSLARFSFYWWRHNWLLMTSQWPDNCDAIRWIMMSNFSGNGFIHGDIHGRSCKKELFWFDLFSFSFFFSIVMYWYDFITSYFWGLYHWLMVAWMLVNITATSHVHHGISNHWPFDCLFNHLLWLSSEATSKASTTGPLCGESTSDHGFPTQRVNNGEKVFISWRRHGTLKDMDMDDMDFTNQIKQNMGKVPNCWDVLNV